MQVRTLDAELEAVPGTVSVWCGPVGGPPAYARDEHATHYAASMMKVAVLAALYRAAEAGTVDLDAPVPVRNEFVSAAAGAPRFNCTRGYDSDGAVWDRLGGTAPLRWLAERMITRSGNLATNLVLSQLGLAPVAEVWRRVGARHSVTGRGIEDFAAQDAGITNLVTAADLAALFGAIATGTADNGTADNGTPDNGTANDSTAAGALAGPRACRGMLDVLLAQQRREDLAAGLPAGTRVAHKNGWVHGVRHAGGVVFAPDAPPYTLVVCTTTALAGAGDDIDAACRLVARVAAASWADRHRLASRAG